MAWFSTPASTSWATPIRRGFCCSRALHAAGLEAPLAARILGTLLVWGTLARVYSVLRRERHASSWPAVAGLAVLVPNGTLAVSMHGGLEGPLIAFALACGTGAAMRLDAGSAPGDFVRAGAWFALAAWTRPEGILFGLAVGAALWLRPATRGSYAALLVATASAGYVALVAWTSLYYGDPLPNTYYAKVHTVSADILARGATEAAHFLSAYHFAPLLIVALWAASRVWRRNGRGLHALAGIVAFSVFFVYVGGDTLEFHRLWFCLLPLFALLFGDAVAAIECADHPAARVGSAAAIVTIFGLALPASFVGPDLEQLRRDDPFVRDLALIGRALRREPSDSVIAANNIGMLAYESDRTVIDMLGLTDRHIAKRGHKQIGTPGHESYDARYVLDREPDLIFLGMPLAFAVERTASDRQFIAYPSDWDLIRDPRLARFYRTDNLALEDGRFAPVLRRVAPKTR